MVQPVRPWREKIFRGAVVWSRGSRRSLGDGAVTYKAFGYNLGGDNRRTALFAERSDAEKVSRELDVSGRVVVGEIVLFESYDDWHNNQSARTE